jgi:hypothetical protein
MKMAFKNRESKALLLLKQRIEGMKQIDGALDLGNGLSVSELEAKATARQERLDKYNALLVQAGMLSNELDEDEFASKEEGANILSGVKSRFGRDSSEVEAVGGKRLSERKKPVRKKPVQEDC